MLLSLHRNKRQRLTRPAQSKAQRVKNGMQSYAAFFEALGRNGSFAYTWTLNLVGLKDEKVVPCNKQQANDRHCYC